MLASEQATKEAEYREKVADLKQRIESCAARVATEEEQANTAKVCETKPAEPLNRLPSAVLNASPAYFNCPLWFQSNSPTLCVQ